MTQRSRALSCLLILLIALTGCAAPAAEPVAPRPESAPGLPSEPFGYETPVQPDAPWPLFRRDRRNTGVSPLPADYAGDQPWSYRTGKGIFSTPVIAAAGDIYVGSADHVFYALHPDGRVKWSYQTGEIIDSAAALARPGLVAADTAVVIPSGDGYLHAVRSADGAPIWRFDARTAPRASYNNWWEGNVAVGYDGTLYAGNTNFNYYAVTPDGALDWTYETDANAWSIAGIGDDGMLFWGSNDTFIHAVDPAGQGQWTKRTLGFIAASAAVGMDGTLYIGSFDSSLYALDPATGETRWKFKTTDHIYASVALGESAGETHTVYLASADGILYALDAATGALRWRYDAGDPIRSSPVLGAGPTGEGGAILYFGAGNGKLYALNAETGARRWSFDTTSTDPELRDRNDLNGSPALGATGVAIGGETGDVWYVPYDYCLNMTDARCAVEPGEDLPADATGFFYVTPGGTTQLTGAPEVTPGTIITLRLLARAGGETVDAWVCNRPIGCPANALQVTADPPFPFRVEKSADGKYLHIIPETFLEPGQEYTLQIGAQTYTGGAALGNLQLGGRAAGRVEQAFTFSVTPAAAPFPLTIGSDRVDAVEWTRLAVPIPPMMPSLNQIGFDYLDWIIAPVAVGEPDAEGTARTVLWAVGGARDADGVLRVDPESDFTLPLGGEARGEDFILSNRDFTMEVTGIPIPFNLLQMRGRLQADGRVAPGASLIADTDALSIPTFGPYLVIAGLANDWYKKLLVAGTFITRAYDDAGGANVRPEGVSLTALTYEAPTAEAAGQVVATLTQTGGAPYDFAAHRPAILLLDAATTEPVWLDYHANLTTVSSGDGATVELTLPAGTVIPAQTDAIVILDVFPLERRPLE